MIAEAAEFDVRRSVPSTARTSEPASIPDAAPPRLVAESVTIGYDDGAVVHDVDLELLSGGLNVMVGPNGCGKSTLLKAMARVLKPMSGHVLLDGQAVHDTHTKTVARTLALLPQGPVAPEGLTVRELVAQGRYPHQSLVRQWSREDARAVDWAMDAADVTSFADRNIAHLSGGQRQRCWIAMVLAQKTDIILLDEPTTFLDLKVQVDVMTLLRRIARREGHTFLVALHELNIAAAFADRLVMMRAGRIVAVGPPDRVFTRDNLRDVFDLEADVLHEPKTGRPVCVPTLANELQ